MFAARWLPLVFASAALSADSEIGRAAASQAKARNESSYAGELVLCVDLTNERRTRVGLPALSLSADLEVYAAKAARTDGLAHVGHKYWGATSGSFAENEIPWWLLSRHGSVRNVVIRGIDAFWREGPGGAHYRNMTGRYSEIGCGIFVNGDEVTMTQEFR
jgi:hypothetical protein